MASKNASAASPVSAPIASASAGEVSGPVAMTTLSHRRRQTGNFFAADLDQWLGFECRGDRGGKAVAVDRQRAARRQLVGVGRAASPASRAGASLHAAGRRRSPARRRSGTSSNRRARPIARSCARRSSARPHFMQHHGHAAARDLPGGLAARKAAANDMNRLKIVHRRPKLGPSRRRHNASENNAEEVKIPAVGSN